MESLICLGAAIFLVTTVVMDYKDYIKKSEQDTKRRIEAYRRRLRNKARKG